MQALGLASLAIPMAASAGIAELDKSTGALFSPKSEMLSGGSAAARGIPVSGSRRQQLQPGQALQTVYETRFIVYLARFLLNFDPSAHAWWLQQGFADSWEPRSGSDEAFADNTLAEFAESVEVGLADYFVGPYGSYSSLSAAKAGISAARPAPSAQPQQEENYLKELLFGRPKLSDEKTPKEKVDSAKKGILNLYTLLKARYTSVAAKRHLAILFSFISSPRLQPSNEILALLGESDNATISEIRIVKPTHWPVNEADSRTSSRRGGGYSIEEPPIVTIDEPPALGDSYVPAELRPVLKPTSRVLRISVIDGGEGYTSAPQVTVVQGGYLRLCQATAIIDRSGRVESVILLDPGWGYGGRKQAPPKVKIEPPRLKSKGESGQRAKAVAELEYEIVGAKVVRGGNGYVKTEVPQITITPPDGNPDWFLAVQEQPEMRMKKPAEIEPLRLEVAEMKFSDGNVAYSIDRMPESKGVDNALLDRLQRDPLEMLPPSIRPERYKYGIYAIPSLARIPQSVPNLSPRYRACDPVFGGVGRVPVTKGAVALKASEYARLALSGAVCTVLVRTALNPLELIKTKQQLQNDNELLSFARARALRKGISPDHQDAHEHNLSGNKAEINATAAVAPQETDGQIKLGTLDLISSLIELRGPLALFQSADITFLASLVFGSLGFGATELFRRSFTAFFIAGSGTDEIGLDVVALLAAASLATVVTAAAAAPFEVLRVRSMGLIESVGWTKVLEDFIAEKSRPRQKTSNSFGLNRKKHGGHQEFELRNLKARDILPLWAGFAPTVSRELPFAVVKFLTFDFITGTVITFLNTQSSDGALPIQVGTGPIGLIVSALAGAVAGIAGAVVSHPADLILTKTSASGNRNGTETSASVEEPDWRDVVRELIAQPGGIANLYVGFPARATFFFLVIGLQFFLYDYFKTLLNVGSDDLSLVLDVFYAVRAGLVG